MSKIDCFLKLSAASVVVLLIFYVYNSIYCTCGTTTLANISDSPAKKLNNLSSRKSKNEIFSTNRVYNATLANITKSPVRKLNKLLSLESEFGSLGNLDCILLPNPPNGWWSIIHRSSKFNSETNATIPEGTVLELNCIDSYMLDGSKIVACIDGKWIPEIGQCLKTCPPLHSQTTLSITCTYKDKESENCTNPLEGTYAQVTCGYFYKDIRRNRRKIFCENGKWSENITTCVPACGQAEVDPTLIVRGTITKRGDFPWQVAIYERERYHLLICSGSLISKKLVLTAAHCLTDEYSIVLPKDKFFVVVGKYYREYNDDRDIGKAQFSNIRNIVIDEHYGGAYKLFQADIALIVTSTTFILSERVRPVCIDWTETYKNEILDSEESKMGEVPGWGYTEYGKPSDVMKNLTVPVVSYQECNKKLPKNFREYFTIDKICAGYFKKGISLCKGDSGGGLILKFDSKYYVTGVVSVAPSSKNLDNCDQDQYSLYTNVYHYIETFILPEVIAFKAVEDLDSDECRYDPKKCDIFPYYERPYYNLPPPVPYTCTLPSYPDNGKWLLIYLPSYEAFVNSTFNTSLFELLSLESETFADSTFNTSSSLESFKVSLQNTQESPFNYVLLGAILKIICDSGFKLQGNATITCIRSSFIYDAGEWTSYPEKCIKICPNINNTKYLKVKCYHQNKEMKNCTDPFEGTVARIKCAPFYESKLTEHLPLICSDHKWVGDVPECIPRCGQPKRHSHKHGGFPWHIAVYDFRREIFICGGTLITEKMVLTAANCVTNAKGDLLPKENFSLAAGKFRDERDSDVTQSSSVSKILLPSLYKTSAEHSIGDVAILVAKTAFKLSHQVQPICIDWSGEYQKEVLNPKSEDIKFFIDSWSDGKDVFSHVQEVYLFKRNDCKDLLDENILTDKLCSAKLNTTKNLGSGLVFKKEGRYHLAGVSNIPLKQDAFEKYHYFTNIYNYTDSFLLKNIG